jgi:anthranilate synthase component 1
VELLSHQINQPVDLLALHRQHPERYPYLLESVARGTPQARFDILFAFPGKTLTLRSPGEVYLDESRLAGGFLESLDDLWASEFQQITGTMEELPFRGGWFVYLGYELAAEIETSLRLPFKPGSLPIAFATRVPCAIIRDHTRHLTTVVAEAGNTGYFDQMLFDLGDTDTTLEPEASCLVEAITEDPEADYLQAVGRILDYIRDGDVFQVNLSRKWLARISPQIETTAVYALLRENNPAPFAGLAQWQETAILSSSPERLVKTEGRRIHTRPIAGTRQRSSKIDEDRAYSAELMNHPKEQAEHIMLIDLERNDLGRICEPGTISANELRVLESYAHVHHIVSNVRGMLRPGITPGDVIRAVFPGGTITGCPKVRCMEIIAELERQPRSAYTGSMGYLNHDGDMDLNILIRTMIRENDQILLRAGAGIVADSDPVHELMETRAKAKGLLMSLGLHQNG